MAQIVPGAMSEVFGDHCFAVIVHFCDWCQVTSATSVGKDDISESAHKKKEKREKDLK